MEKTKKYLIKRLREEYVIQSTEKIPFDKRPMHGHGNCCMCINCGYSYDEYGTECACPTNEILGIIDEAFSKDFNNDKT